MKKLLFILLFLSTYACAQKTEYRVCYAYPTLYKMNCTFTVSQDGNIDALLNGNKFNSYSNVKKFLCDLEEFIAPDQSIIVYTSKEKLGELDVYLTKLKCLEFKVKDSNLEFTCLYDFFKANNCFEEIVN